MSQSWKISRIIISFALVALAVVSTARAEPDESPASQVAVAPTPEESSRVRLNFPENVELKVLIDYLSQRHGMSFLYDEQIGGRRVTIKVPQEIPASSLLPLVESAMKMKGLAISRTDVPGMWRIEPIRQLTVVSTGPPTQEAAREGEPTEAVTRVLELKHARPQRVEQIIQPFLSVPQASVAAVAEHNLLIITDYADNLKRLEAMIAVVDRPGRDVPVQYVPLQHLEAGPASQQLTQLWSARQRLRDGGAGVGSLLTVQADERANQIVLVGPGEEVAEAVAMLGAMDVDLGLRTKVYPFTTTSAERAERMIRNTIDPQSLRRLYRGSADRETNVLIAHTTPSIHKQIEELQQMLDRPVVEAQSPIRFYKLQNAKALSVVETLRGIEGEKGMEDISLEDQGVKPYATNEEPPAPAAPERPDVTSTSSPESPRPLSRDGAQIMADEASNTIIVIAKPAMQPIYEQLIQRLDVRRPQVLIEATIVTIDTTDGFSLGVEISSNEPVNDGEGKVINFTQFGLSDADPATGALTLKPGVGFNGALISADIAQVILRALRTDGRAKVMARPSVLVNDNAKGKIESKSEEPFSSVNASNTVSTTSFGGYASAGTVIEVTPQISEGDHLKLDYEIILSSFGDGGTSTLPPSRQSNSLKSEATIPNGYTIVLGGLTQNINSSTIDRVPVLGELPGLEYLFSTRRTTERKTTLFVFIHAVILREDKFEGLKLHSQQELERAELPSDFPASEPVTIPSDVVLP